MAGGRTLVVVLGAMFLVGWLAAAGLEQPRLTGSDPADLTAATGR